MAGVIRAVYHILGSRLCGLWIHVDPLLLIPSTRQPTRGDASHSPSNIVLYCSEQGPGD